MSGRPLVEKISRREPSSSAEAPSPYTDDIDINDTDGHRTERAGQEAAASHIRPSRRPTAAVVVMETSLARASAEATAVGEGVAGMV